MWREVLLELNKTHVRSLENISKQDLVRFCMENKTIRNNVSDYLKSIKVTRKDSVVALQKKEEGNRNFLDKKYEESLRLYTNSIYCSNKNDEVLPLAYSNRSLVLQKLGHLTESINDIDMALATGYPKDKAKKLKLRKAKYLAELSAQKDINLFIHSHGPHGLSKKLLYKHHVKEYQLPKLVGGENKDFASASAYLGVYFDENKGRHVIATKNIKLGEVLFVEKAFAFVAYEQVCTHCLKKTIAPIPCENCLDVTYCSLKCREDSWKASHSFQCGFNDLFNSIGIAHLGLQVILGASSSVDELKNKLESISEPKYENGPVLFKSQGYDSVYNLVHHSDNFEVNDLFQYTVTALLLATYMKNYTNYFSTKSGDEDLKLLTSVILRHILQMICNGHIIMEAFIRGTKDSMLLTKSENRIATAIYPSVSMMNHSCLPSVIIGFYKTYIIVQAAVEIKKGEEVFNCYGADARRMERALRQEILSKQYFFKCECQECVQEFDFQDRFNAFKCNACNGPSVQKDKNALEAICIDCGQKSKISVQLISKVHDFYSLLTIGKQLIIFDAKSLLIKALKAWNQGREIFYKYHKDLCCAADNVAACLAKLGDFKRSISFVEFAILSVEERFGLLSLEMIQELNKFYDVLLACISTSVGEPSRNSASELNLTMQRKILRIMNILDGNPYFDPEKLTSAEEFMQAFC